VKRIVEILPALLFVAGLALYVPRLAVPEHYIFDEVYHAYTAGQYVAGNHDAYVWTTRAPQKGVAYMWNHPPLGLHLISVGIRLWGDRSFGWRFMSAVCGALGLVVAYQLAFALTAQVGIALLAAFLLWMDGLYFVQARTGMLDVFGVVFMMVALLHFHRYWTAPPERSGSRLAMVGLFLGFAIATKWNAAYASVLVGLAALARTVWLARRPEAGAKVAVRHLGWVALALGVIPAVVYLFAYVPFFRAGHDFKEFVELQRQIWIYHHKLTETHAYQSRWWEWPLVLRPVWYHVTRTGDTIANVYAQANPILHWALLPAMVWAVPWWVRRRDPAWLTAGIGFFGQWLPWALISRISFAYHFLPMVPFGCIALALAMSRLAQGPKSVRWIPWAYGAAVVAAFIFFYPIYACVPLTEREFSWRLWLPTWR
jgi:dolichyl-phosphate-mannose--protein O-mannosyl transferase